MNQSRLMGLIVVLSGLILAHLGTPVLGATDAFVLENNPLLPMLFTSSDQSPASGIFQNFAKITSSNTSCLTISTGQDFYGYSFLSVGYATTFKALTLGMGYQTLFASDIPKTQLTSDRPTLQGYIEHRLDLLRFSAGFHLTDFLQVAGSLSQSRQSLDTYTGQLRYGDIGIWGIFDRFRCGVFTTHLVSYPQADSRISVELEYHASIGQIGYGFYNAAYHSVYGAWRVVDVFELNGRVLADQKGKIASISLGPVLNLNNWSLQYLYTMYYAENLDSAYHMLGIKWNL